MRIIITLIVTAALAGAQDDIGQRAAEYLTTMIRQDTSNPPGNETRTATYLKQVTDKLGIPGELLGPDPNRLNFIARLKGTGANRPLLLMAHSDVVPADPSQWTVDPFAAINKDGVLYGRGTVDDKSLLAAELAVFAELKRRNVRLNRDVILLSESDEEAGSTGIAWLIKNAFEKIDAEFALNEGGYAMNTPSGTRIFQVQTSEKIPTRIKLIARGTAGHGSRPLPDNPVVHVARAITRLADAEEPVRLNTTTRRYLDEVSRLPDYQWLKPLLPKLEDSAASSAAANQITGRNSEIGAMLRTTVSPTMLQAGLKVNIIPNTAEAQVDVRRLPNETREEVLERFRKIINDSAITIDSNFGQQMPATEPSSLTTSLYKAMDNVLTKTTPKAMLVPYVSLGASDGAFLREKGMAVYGVPVFIKEADRLAHGNDERISIKNLQQGTELLLQIVLEVAVEK
jgi:acetylornithine deacetylase/succinyl-diaminopimelate desuccinylase-like protein